MNNINQMSTPNQMRKFMKRLREGGMVSENTVNSSERDLTMRDMLKITRNINENKMGLAEDRDNMKSVYDQDVEEEKFKNFFNDLKVNPKFIELEVYDDLIFWGGTMDGIIQFVYKVTPDESTSGVYFNYLPNFSPDNPENDEIIGRIKSYYDNFYKYWRDNVMTDYDDDTTDEIEPKTMKISDEDNLNAAAE